jgi:hypothetical protein
VSVESFDAFLLHLTAGPTAHRAQQATAQQQLLISALDKQAAAAVLQERALATKRRQLLQQVSLPFAVSCADAGAYTIHCSVAFFGAN